MEIGTFRLDEIKLYQEKLGLLAKTGVGRKRGDNWKERERKLAENLLFAGNSVRAVAKVIGLSKRTVDIVRAEIRDKINAICECGKIAGHKGWCSTRFNKSIKRQKFVDRWHAQRLVPKAQPRCTEKACPYPSMANGLCTAHAKQQQMVSSLIGSSLGNRAVQGLL